MTALLHLYDFDHTVYGGDSTIDFYLFCVRRDPRLLRYLPAQGWHAVMFFLGRENTTTFKGHFFRFLRAIDTAKLVDEFWEVHYGKMRAWYLLKDHARDVIISSSPEFLLSGVARRIGALALIGTVVDPSTGAIKGRNCRGLEKVKRFQEQFKNASVESAYSDHLSDLPMLGLAKHPYLVKGETVRALPRTTAR